MLKVSWKFEGLLARVAGLLNWLGLVRVTFRIHVDGPAVPPPGLAAAEKNLELAEDEIEQLRRRGAARARRTLR